MSAAAGRARADLLKAPGERRQVPLLAECQLRAKLLWSDLPPVRSSHFAWRPHHPNNLGLLVPRQPPIAKPGQSLLDQPSLQCHSGRLTVAIELRCHAQRLKGRVHTAGRDRRLHNGCNTPDTSGPPTPLAPRAKRAFSIAAVADRAAASSPSSPRLVMCSRNASAAVTRCSTPSSLIVTIWPSTAS